MVDKKATVGTRRGWVAGWVCALLLFVLPAAAGPAERPFAPSRGQNRVLVILVNFSDTTTTYTPAQFEDLFFGQHESTFRDYYQKASYGQLDHVGDIVGWVRASKTHDYYANNEYGQAGWKSYPTNAHQLVMEAVDLAEAAGVNFRLYDNPLDGATDGIVDTLVVVHQGRGGEVINNPKNIWSFVGALSDGGAYARTYDGVVIDNFIIVPEVSWYNDRIIEAGPLVHEYGHLLGLLDLYDRDGGSAGIGRWDVMSNGVWGGDLNSPQLPVYPSAYSRVDLGWVTPLVVGGSTQGWFELPASSQAAGVIKILANRRTDREYFLAEYRPKDGYDRNLPAGGVAVYHIDYRALFENRDTFIGCGSLMPRVALEQADGRYDLERYLNYGDTADLYPRPSGSATAFHAATVPDTRNHDCRLSGFSLTGFTFAGDTAWVYALADDFRPHTTAPELIPDPIEWIEVAGDGDRYLETGEIFQPVLTLENSGATAFSLSASIVSDSPFLLIGSTELLFADLAPGDTGSAAGGPYMTVLPGYDPEVVEPLLVTFSYNGGTQEATVGTRLGSSGLLYVDDDGGDITERHLGPYLIDYGYYHDFWDVAVSGPPTATDLAGYATVFWVTGLTDEPLDADELAALQAYLDGGGTLVLSSAYLLINPTVGAQSFAHNYLHVNAWVDDRYAIDRLRGFSYNPLSYGLWIGPMNFYYPMFNRTVGLTPDALAMGAALNDRSHYATVYYPADPEMPTVFRTIFNAYGTEHIHRQDLGQMLRRAFNVFNFRTGMPWVVRTTPERAQPRKVNLTTRLTGFAFSATDVFSFPGSGITVAASTWLSAATVDLVIRVAWDAGPGWHDLLITTADGDTVRVPRIFKVEGEPLPNHAPDARAGDDQQVYRNATVTLDAGASSDADYDLLAFEWQQTAGPPVTLSPSDTSKLVTFDSGDFVGAYKFELIVSDPFLSDSDSITVTVINRAPQADAGENDSGWRSDVYTLDSRGSSDPDDDTLSARWVQLSGPPVAVLPSDTAVLAGIIPDPDWVGDYRFQLEVSDPWTMSSDTVTFSVINQAPVADAGENQRVASATWVTLDGSASFDLDGDSLEYFWLQDTGPEVILDLTDPVRPLFFILEPGNYHFTLSCQDPFESSPADGVTVMINLPPVAEAGPGTEGYRGEEVVLDGSLSYDPNGDTITYEWEQVFGPPVTLTPGDTAEMTGFVAPNDYQGNFVFQLTVSDGVLSDSDTVTVTVLNRPPLARAGEDQAGLRSQIYLLDGDSSSDPDGDQLTYEWTQLTGPEVSLLPSDTAEAVFFSPAQDWIGRYVFELHASDPWDFGGDTVAVTITNQPPVAHAGPDLFNILGDTVTLDGDSSLDPDGDPLDYIWQQIDGPAVTLDLTNPSRPTFAAAATGNYLFSLVVDDSFDVSDADTVTVIVLTPLNHVPVAEAGPNQQLDWMDFSPVQLDGMSSSDADGDTLTYHWTMVSKPPLSSASLSDPASPNPTFYDDYLGTYVLRLSVYDGEVWSQPDEMTVLTTGNTIDTDGDGDPDCLDEDDDNDTLPDEWETAHGLDPLSSADADPNTLDPLTDPDGDGNGNIHEYYNDSDPQADNRRDCSERLGACFFGDSDGDFFYSPADLAGYSSLIKGNATSFPMVYPRNGDNFDLDGDGFISPADVSQIGGVIKGGDFPSGGMPTSVVVLASGYTVEVAQGATVGLSFRVVSADGKPRSGLAVVFELLTGTGDFLGGEGALAGNLTISEPGSFNTSYNESAFALSRDELEVVVASDRPGGMGGFDLYTARRESSKAAFPALSPVGEVNSSLYETTPALSADRLELYFARFVSSWDIYRSTRPDTASVWSIPQPVTELNTTYLESAPSITDDGLTIYFVRYISASPAHQIYRASRLTTASPFDTPVVVTELNSNYTDNLPNISGDNLRIYFMSNRPAGGANYNIWYAERANTALPFSSPVPLSLVNTSVGDLQAWESSDRLRLYITTYGYHATNDVNIYLIQRPSPDLPFWVSSRPARYDVTGKMAEDAEQDSGGRVRMAFRPEGCGSFDIATYGPEDPRQKLPGFSAARLVRVSVPCP